MADCLPECGIDATRGEADHSMTDSILTIRDHLPKALLTNINGDVHDIKWGSSGSSAKTLCSIEHQNQIYTLGQVSLNFPLLTFLTNF